MYGIPDWLKPYPENFKWETRFFKALVSKYIDDVLLFNKRDDYWLTDGIQTFLMMEYINKYYPDVTVFGRFSNLWGFRNYNLAKLKQNDKYPFLSNSPFCAFPNLKIELSQDEDNTLSFDGEELECDLTYDNEILTKENLQNDWLHIDDMLDEKEK